MDDPILTMEEREAINTGRWFSSLSPSLRHDILRCAFVRRYQDGDLIAARGEPPDQWIACAKGAVRVSSTTLTGKQITLTYVEPGIWFGDVAIFDGDRRTHDAYAHGATTILNVARADFQKILALHPELYEALLKLQARRIRLLFGQVEDLNTLPLRARLAKQLLHLSRSYGVPGKESTETRIGLPEVQLGIHPGWGGTARLPRLIGAPKALAMMLTGRAASAERALAEGLVDRVVAPEALDKAVEAEIVPYFSASPEAVAASKALAHALAPPIDGRLIEMTLTRLADTWETPEAAEGIAAFLEKRKAKWVVDAKL